MTQDGPIMDGSTEASDESKIAGIVEQVRYDMRLRLSDDTGTLLRQRLDDTGLQVSSEEFARLVADIDSGPSAVE
jgi:hypothetical protein